MPENIQDKLISDYEYTEYDIAYPVIITRWEIMQVKGLDKRYLQIYFQKISDTVKSFKFNVKCYSDFGEVENITDILLQEIDKKDLEFSKVIPLKSEVSRVEIFITQCLLLDNSMIEPKGKQIVLDTFIPFNDEDLEAAKRLLPTAKGLPIDNVSHWYCACGALYSSDTKRCEKCNKSKKEVFSLIIPETIQEEKVKAENDAVVSTKAKKKKKITIASIASGCTAFVLILFLILWFTVIPIRTVTIKDVVYDKVTSPPNHYMIQSYEGNEKQIVISSNVRGLPVYGVFSRMNGSKSVKKIIIQKGMKDCKYHTIAEHYNNLILTLYKGFENLQTIYLEEEPPKGISRYYKIGTVEIIWGYK